MDALLAIAVGLGLAATCGLRAFVPVLGLSIAARMGWIGLPGSMGFLASDVALAALLVATALEVLATSVPALANLLDVLAAPAAMAAGTLAAGSQFTGIVPNDPLLGWAAALVAGGGTAGLVHVVSALGRTGATVASGGILTPAYGLAESFLAAVLSILAALMPILMILALGSIAAIVTVVILRRPRRNHAAMPSVAR
jgi:hypothetical protein